MGAQTRQPAVCDMVLYSPPGHEHDTEPTASWAAVVTAVHDDGVSLTVFPPGHLPGYPKEVVPYDVEGTEPHSWRWPDDPAARPAEPLRIVHGTDLSGVEVADRR